MSLQIGFFPNKSISKEYADLRSVGADVPRQSLGSNQKEVDPELEKLLELFCKPSAEKTIIC